MPLSVGERLGSYKILAQIGAGGMGEVYRARDTKLDRDVAIKVLPAAVDRDPERLARFQREAKVLAALNHPNIAAIYGLEDRAIVMELVEGPTLAERIQASPLELKEGLRIALSIADALEAAHDKGVVHRDLKPANVKAPLEGAVKVLDLGLATALPGTDREASDPANSPTLTMAATEMGVIMGTAAYMSPEQASGKRVDKRADIWSFGVVLYEMLTGKRLFDGGETVSHTLADVLRAEIDFRRLPAGTPEPVRELLKRCLDRDVKSRLRDIGEARVAIARYLANPVTSESVPAQARPSSTGWIAVAGVMAIALAAVSFFHFREPSRASPEMVRFPILLPDKVTGQFPSISPDGRRVVFRAAGEGGVLLWVRSLDSLETKPLEGTEGSGNGTIWSYDSRSIVFGVQGKLKKMDASGGPAETLCSIAGPLGGGFWTRDNRIIFAPTNGPISEVAASGGNPSPVTLLATGETGHGVVSLLPDGKHFVYLRRGKDGGIFVGSLDAAPDQQGSKRLLLDDSIVYYAPPLNSPAGGSGHLLFVRENTLMAQPFDATRLELTGEAVAIAEQVANLGGFSASATGALVYGIGDGGKRQLTWFDRQGNASDSGLAPGPFQEIEMSPDGTRVAIGRNLSQNRDIWVYDFARGASTRLTSDPAADMTPVWSPDGKRIFFYSNREGVNRLFVKLASGAGNEEVVLKYEGNGTVLPQSWSRDGRFLLYEPDSSKTARDLWVLPFEGGVAGKPAVYLNSASNETQGQFSPDGHFVAYVSTESTGPEVYISTFPDPKGGRWPISNGGGYQPRWRRDGRELLYMTGDGRLMSVDVTLGASSPAGVAKALFRVPIPGTVSANQTSWDISPDGQKFLINTVAAQSSAPLTVVLNWQAGLKK